MTHESNGIDIITALILNDISPLCKYRMDLVLQLKVGLLAAHTSVHVTWVHVLSVHLGCGDVFNVYVFISIHE